MPFVSTSLSSVLHTKKRISGNLAGAAFPLFTTQMYDRMTFKWANTVFACIALLMVPIPFIVRTVHCVRHRIYFTNEFSRSSSFGDLRYGAAASLVVKCLPSYFDY